jgi:hypothetical protein
LRHGFESVRGRRAPARQGGQKSTEQAGPVSHNPNPTDFNDQAQQVEPEAIGDIENHTLYRRCHLLSPSELKGRNLNRALAAPEPKEASPRTAEVVLGLAGDVAVR